ncbi:MAG: phosphatidylserine decarboxylase family protein [Bacteroidales bacterium]|jgi:phosphatidylserine decarboxylase|nr:phosphatidylserine decarboxylase family protein [Bacteroidales bacterium]
MKIHKEGTEIILAVGLGFLVVNALTYFYAPEILFYTVLLLTSIPYWIVINFFRSPSRHFQGDTHKTVVSSVDGKVVVVEEVLEDAYFHDKRLQISVFMTVLNVHANWFPVNGIVKHVSHQNGRFMAAYLPKSSTENERSTVVIETPEGVEILVRQIAGAMARRIVTYAEEGDKCHVDDHLGFIKFGSRVDIYLPLGTEVCVKVDEIVTGNQTVIAKLK